MTDGLYERRLALRTQALAQGVDLIGWPFDAFDVADAYLSIARLGAIVERYAPDDERLLAEWWIRRPHVERRLSPNVLTVRAAEAADAPLVTPDLPAVPVTSRRLWLAVSSDAPRPYLHAALGTCFASGYRIVDFQIDATDRGRYLLARPGDG